MAAEGFFRRWSARKAESRKQDVRPDREAARDEVFPDPDDNDRPDATPARLPTMEDVRRLTPESDYAPFVAKGMDPAVRRAALKTLFSNPHFNRMDGLDVYIDDYNRHVPLTPAMLAALQHTRSMLGGGQGGQEAVDAASPKSEASAAIETEGGNPTQPDQSRDGEDSATSAPNP